MFKRFFSKEKKEVLDKGLEKSKTSFLSKITKIISTKSVITNDDLDEIEEMLISSDVGLQTTKKIIDNLEIKVKRDKYINADELSSILKNEISMLMNQYKFDESIYNSNKPYVIMVVGVNGVGKTTTIGKLANKYKQLGKKVLLGASDTFRAAAVDQLNIWADRVDVDIISKGMNADPAAVAFETIKHGVENNHDIIIIDTAGRLHNNINLMNELSKIKRVMNKVISNSPHEIMLVLDGSTGQNAIEQCKQFTLVTEVNSLAITKLDGTAKGGVVIGISDQFKIPVKYIGVGEQKEDLQDFVAHEFVDSLIA